MKKFELQSILIDRLGEAGQHLASNLYDITMEDWREHLQDLEEVYEGNYLKYEEDLEKILEYLELLGTDTITQKLNTKNDSGLYYTEDGHVFLFIYKL